MMEYFSVKEKILTDYSKVFDVVCPWLKIAIVGDENIAQTFANNMNKLLNDGCVLDVAARE